MNKHKKTSGADVYRLGKNKENLKGWQPSPHLLYVRDRSES